MKKVELIQLAELIVDIEKYSGHQVNEILELLQRNISEAELDCEDNSISEEKPDNSINN
ncbi:hypothetical protein [Dysgonomonas sp. BGC7]|uniref:hypothetical protein n=1 Tax=Dysgonomonas sp. BGC7 TaxID=1658008 RepID=UPI000AED280F|nr:hypothetical protein [Dysgonomonas sp. BGC7]MBD8389294.1 hypothetical protein [Dysgonomonas sp. BGC7]